MFNKEYFVAKENDLEIFTNEFELVPSEIVWNLKSFLTSNNFPSPLISDTIQGVEAPLNSS